MITQNHFGGHALASIHTPDSGGALERLVNQIDFTSIRYPGGTITERIAMDGRWRDLFANERQGAGKDELVTVSEIQEFADANGLTIQFVLPTFSLLNDSDSGHERAINQEKFDEIIDSVRQLLEGKNGPVRVEHFSIGNEWWSADPNFGVLTMSATEYGRLVNKYLEELPSLIDETVGRDSGPKIAVQAGVGFRPNSNADILNEISLENRGEIDTIIQHFYPRTYETAADRQLLFDLAHQMANAPGMIEPEFLVSEWNVQASSEGDRGMLHAQTILQTFDVMINNNVTNANIWGTNYRFLETRLAEMSHNHWEGTDPEDINLKLTPAGHVYRIMARELPGTSILDSSLDRIIEYDDEFAGKLRVNDYYSDDKSITFLSSRSEDAIQVELNLDSLAPNGEHVWVRVFGAEDDPTTVRDESVFDSHLAMAQFRTFNGKQLRDEPELTLPPGGILVVTVTRNEEIGAWIEGDHQVINPDFSFDDYLIGTSGDDKLLGGNGDDILLGGAGRDILDSGSGRNHLDGEDGEDLLISRGRDSAVLGHRDTLIANGEAVSATVSGDDTLIFVISGRADIEVDGSATIVVGNNSEAFISGFNPERDLIAIEGEPSSADDWAVGVSEVEGDLVMSWGASSITLFDMAHRFEEVMQNRYHDRDEEELEVILADTLGPMSFMQRAVLEREVDVNDFMVELLDLAPDSPAPTSGYGRRVEKLVDHSDSVEFSEDKDESLLDEITLDDQNGDDKPYIDDDSGIYEKFGSDEEEDDDFSDKYQAGRSSSQSDGSCFVATAAYRDPSHVDVVFLRLFRDRWLAERRWGRGFISFYWWFGPKAAKVVKKSDFLAVISKAILSIVVEFLRFAMRGRF